MVLNRVECASNGVERVSNGVERDRTNYILNYFTLLNLFFHCAHVEPIFYTVMYWCTINKRITCHLKLLHLEKMGTCVTNYLLYTCYLFCYISISSLSSISSASSSEAISSTSVALSHVF